MATKVSNFNLSNIEVILEKAPLQSRQFKDCQLFALFNSHNGVKIKTPYQAEYKPQLLLRMTNRHQPLQTIVFYGAYTH